MLHTHRNHRRRRTSSVVGALVVLGLVAAACGGDDSSSTTVAPTDTTAPDDTSDPGEPDDTTAPDTSEPSDTTAPDTTAPGSEPQPGGKVIMGVEADTASPWRPSEMLCAISCHQVIRSVYDPLTLPGSNDQPQPFLAESFEPNEDYTVWRITARSGVTFHDGTPFDGAAIVENLQRHKTALLTGVIMRSVNDITLDPADPMVAVVTVDAPWVLFPNALSGQVGYMASPTWLAASDADVTLKSRPVGTGPFVFAEYRPGETFRATRNADYWLDPYPYLDEIEFRPIDDALTRRDALQNGIIDLMHTTNGSVIAGLRADPERFPFDELTYKGETAYALLHVTQELPDGSPSPLQDQRVRCALQYSQNNQLLIDTISAGVPPAANGPFSPTQVGWLEDTGWPMEQNMAEAQRLIDDYKAENPGPITLALALTDDDTNLTIAGFQKQWGEEAGIDEISIDQIDQGNYIVTAALGQFQVFQWRNHGGFDLDSQYHWWHSSSSVPVGELGINFGRIRDDRLDALLEENRASDDADRKREIAEEVNTLFAEECYNLWGSWTVWAVAGKPGLHGKSGTDLVLPDGLNAAPGSGIAGTFYLQTLWLES